jgi:hypothetical protein
LKALTALYKVGGSVLCFGQNIFFENVRPIMWKCLYGS